LNIVIGKLFRALTISISEFRLWIYSKNRSLKFTVTLEETGETPFHIAYNTPKALTEMYDSAIGNLDAF